MSDKYTVTVSTISAYDSEVVVSYTGTLEELVQWGYFGDPTNPIPYPRCNPFNDDLYIIEDAVNPVTGKIVKGYRWFNDGHGDNPAHPAVEDPQAVKAIDPEISGDIKAGEIELDEVPEREYITLHPQPLELTYENVLAYLKYACEDTQHVVKLEKESTTISETNPYTFSGWDKNGLTQEPPKP